MMTLNPITAREKDVLKLDDYELTSEEISDPLCISANIVNADKNNLREKQEVENIAVCLLSCFEFGLLTIN